VMDLVTTEGFKLKHANLPHDWTVSYKEINTVMAAVFSPDGRTFVTAGDGVRVWETATGLPVGRPLVLHKDLVHSVAFSPDGRTLVTASSDGTARLWETPTGQPPRGRSALLQSHAACLALSPDGKTLLVGGKDRYVYLLEPATGKLRGPRLSH